MSEMLSPFTAVCIAGMHRSGTSLAARLLHTVGLHLGPEELLAEGAFDNPDGYWENVRCVAINDALLAAFGGAWDAPPVLPAGWESAPEVRPLHGRASALVRHLALERVWGWKDPRNSLTLPFWREVVPALRIVVCVRNPVEVAISLRNRNLRSSTAALKLWLDYNNAILDATSPADRVVTEFTSWLHEPIDELERVATAIGLNPEHSELAQAASLVRRAQRHFEFTWDDLVELEVDPEVLNCYRRLALEADVPSAADWQIPENAARHPALVDPAAVEARLASRGARMRPLEKATAAPRPSEHAHIRRLRLENDQLTDALRYHEQLEESLRQQLRHMQSQRDWHVQDRDSVVRRLEETGAAQHHLEQRLEDKTERVTELERALAELEGTRAVSIQRRYWSMLARLRGRKGS